MSSVGSFGTFTTARLAIYVSQKGLSVTGNNIANINTVGYTRQRLDQVSFKTGMADRYQNSFDVHVGNGAIAQSVSQLRDPYLDIRYRAEHSSEGFYNGKLEGLESLKKILDETNKGDNDGDGLLYAQFQKFFSALQNIQVDRGHEVNDTLAQTSAKALCELFYNAANQLERLKNNTETQLRQELNGINELLVNIRNLNESIQQAEIYGDPALELRDTRNNLIDKLSEKVKIEATYSAVDIGGKQIEKLTIRLGNANPDKDVNSDSSILVDGNYCAQLTTPKVNDAYNALYDKTSDAYQAALEGFAKNPPVPVVDADGNPITTADDLNAAIEAAANDPDKKMLQYRYLDPNDEVTNDPRVADQVFDDNYNVTVSDLRNKKNEEWVYYPDTRDTYVKDDTGFPTKAECTGSFKFFGTWKDGDKVNIDIGGDTYTVEVGKDVTADAANSDPKNLSNAIRKAMVDSGKLNDYEITTRTTRLTENNRDGFNVQLSVKAKDPEEKTLAEMPAISITSNPVPNAVASAAFGAPAAVTPPTTPPSYSVAVTSGNPNKFNTGDVISIATNPAVTLTVGKDISVNGANDPARLASKLAGRMKVNGYTVSSTTDKDGNASLIFKATADGAPAPTLPQPVVTPAEPVDFTNLNNGTWTNGKPGDVPKPDPKIEDNGDNTTSKVITRYYMDDNDKWHQTVKTITTSKTKMLDDNDLFGELQAIRELMTEEGEFASQADINMDESAAIKRGIPYYQQALDLLARQFATTMNEANNGFAVDEKGNYLDANGNVLELELAGQPVTKNSKLTEAQEQELIDGGCFKTDLAGNKVADLNRWLEAKGAEKMGGNLFSNRGDNDDGTGITALNISVSQSWNKGDVHVVPTYIKLFGGETNNTTQQDNALHMGHLMYEKLVYNPQDLVGDAVSTHLFYGSFPEMFEKMSTTLGEDQSTTKISLETHMGQALDIDTSRDSVSAVDLNDEAMNLMQYTHSLNAAYRLMTTIDDMIERLITGTGVTR